MRVRAWIVAVVTAGSLTGCAGVEPEPAAEPTSAAPGSAFLEPGWRLTEDMVQAYHEALAKIDGQLAQDEDLLSHAGRICRDIRQGKTDAEVVKYAATQFEVEAAVAKQIVEATKSTVCVK